MRQTIVVSLMMAVVCGAASAGEYQARLAPVWPLAKLDVKTDGAATATLGVNFQWSLPSAPLWDASILPQASVATSSGVAQLFSDADGKESGPTSWSGGVSLSLMRTEDLLFSQAAAPHRKAKAGLRAAFRLCQDWCKDNKNGAGTPDQRVCLDLSRLPLRKLMDHAATEMCSAGAALLASIQAAHAEDDNTESARLLCIAEDHCDQAPNNASLYCAELVGAQTSGEGFNPNHLCDAGKAIVQHQPGDRMSYSSPFDRWLISAGATVAGGAFSYYTADPMMNISKQSATKVGWSTAASITYVRAANHLTVEVPFVYADSWRPSPTPIHSCSTVGQVPRMGGSDPAQTCFDGVFGAPGESSEVYTSVQLGYVDLHAKIDPDKGVVGSSFWRFSVGPSLRQRMAAGDDTTIVGIEAPLYLNFAATPAGDEDHPSKSFTGLLRVTPIIGAAHDAGGWSSYVLVTLTALADTTMFRRALDWK